MKNTKEKVEIMQAYLRGEQIEFCYNDEDIKLWDNTDGEPQWDWKNKDYRIKPEKKYAPFETVEEFLKSQKKYGDKVTHVLTGYKFRTYVSSNEHVCAVSEEDYSDVQLFCFTGLFRNFRFENNLPCGKEIENETI